MALVAIISSSRYFSDFDNSMISVKLAKENYFSLTLKFDEGFKNLLFIEINIDIRTCRSGRSSIISWTFFCKKQ